MDKQIDKSYNYYMYELDDIKYIKKLDRADMLGSIELLGRQVAAAFDETKKLRLPADCNPAAINKVVINGMGGSGLGAHVLKSLYAHELKIPVEIVHDYHLPSCVDKNTLVILNSYSGSTEEILASLLDAKKRGAKILVMATGGKLGALARQGELPGYIYSPRFNPSNQPRMGIGYAVMGLLGLFKKCSLIKIGDKQVNSLLKFLREADKNFCVSLQTPENIAKQAADHLMNREPVVITAEFLAGNAHIFSNQLNENAKTFASYYILPELNHHLLEGLTFPKNNSKNLFFVFLSSSLFAHKNQERLKITEAVLKRNKIEFLNYRLSSAAPLEQSFEALLFSSYVSFYLAILYGVNPADIPWVDYFKAQLK